MLLSLLYMVVSLCLASPLFTELVSDSSDEDLVSSLSAPGFTFRRAKPFKTLPQFRNDVQNGGETYFEATRLPLRESGSGRRSAAALIYGMQLDDSSDVYGNVSAVDHYATQYSVTVLLNGAPMSLIIDTASSDTWVKGMNFTCSNPSNDTACDLGPAYPENDFPDGHIQNQHFGIQYGDGENIAGQLGYMDVEIAGVTVKSQEIGLAAQGAYSGHNVTSGVLGMAYPALTSAYFSDNLTDNDPSLETQYSPLITSLISQGIIQPVWAIAISRNSTKGMFGLGAMPPVNLNTSHYATTDMIIVSSHVSPSRDSPSTDT
jgi:hypothetical protein